MNKPGWKTAEEVAARLERAIAPDATVKHNVHLPVLGSTRTRQCDIAIWYGQEPRGTLAIVEVQKRKGKPSITDFHGWYQKMREVGAQHLICVSEAGFPKSVIEEVTHRIGPTVRLVTLKQLDSDSITTLGLPFVGFAQRQVAGTLVSVGPIQAIDMATTNSGSESFGIATRDTVFIIDEDPTPLTTSELLVQSLNARRITADTTFELDFVTDHHRLRAVVGNRHLEIASFPATISARVTEESIPYDTVEYRQIVHDAELAWLLRARAVSKDGNLGVVELILVPKSDGTFRMAGVHSDITGIVDIEVSRNGELIRGRRVFAGPVT